MPVLPIGATSTGTTIGLSAIVALVVATVATGGVKALLDFAVKDMLARRQADRADEASRRAADRDFEYARRKAVDDLVGEWRGRLVHSAMDMHVRIRNLYTYDERALDRRQSHLYRSTVFRFLAFFRYVVAFERRAIYLESDISRDLDRWLAEYGRCLMWVMTDVRLFDGSGYSRQTADEHFFTEQLAAIATLEIDIDAPFTWTYFGDHFIRTDTEPSWHVRVFRRKARLPPRPVDGAFDFFERLPRKPLAWDRIVCLDLLLVAFLDAVGYAAAHRANRETFDDIASKFKTTWVPRNLPSWLDRQILTDPMRVGLIKSALAQRNG
jgi:hypothetical protein